MDQPPDSRTEVQQSISEARLELVRRVRGGGNWRELVDRSLAHSLRMGDADGFAATIQFIVFLLDAESRYDEGLAEIEHAADVAAGSPTATGFLLAQRAALLSAQGQVGPAMEAVRESEALLEAAGDASGRKWPILLETARLKLLMPPSPRLPALARLGSSADTQADYSFLLSWYIPYLAAIGDRRNAQPLIQLARAAARATDHRWRLSDVQSFETWLAALDGREQVDQPQDRTSTLAVWREATLELRYASLRRDIGGIPGALRRISAALRGRGSADHGGFPPWEAVGTMLVGDGSLLPRLHPPQQVTLESLGTWLAAAYAVALGGSRDLAAAWLTWIRRLGEQGIESSLEWPASRRRIEALLLLRVGRRAKASVEMQRARDWAAARGYRVEEAAADLQAARMATLFGGRQQGTSPTSDPPGKGFLIECGFDPWLHLAVVESAALEGAGSGRHLLTIREIETLKLLADNLSYREAAEQLGISWHTVRGTAHSIYQKLGVGSKHAAAREARRLGLL